MKIQNMELFKVPPRWLILKLTTDDGIVGWGEPIVEGKADAVRACVEELKDQLLGREAGNIEELWQTMYRCNFYRGGPVLTSAMSGIEQALWDVKGKALGVPVYELLGGAVRDKLRMYAWIMAEGDADYLAETQQRIDQGYDTIKMCVTDEMGWVDNVRKVHAAAEKVARIRDRFGYDIDIAVDFHGRVHMPMARMLMKELEPFGLLYIEEPLQPEQIEGFRELRNHTSTPIATGERMYTRWGFKNLIASGAIDIVQPDVSHAGGILESRKIAAMAECYDMGVAPHCPLGPIALASCIQLDFCTPNAFIQEQSLNIHYNGRGDFEYLTADGGFDFANGWLKKPTRPGLGITVDEEKVRRAAQTGHNWQNARWRLSDGTPIDW